MVVVYRVSPMTYRLGRRLVKLDTFAMVNLIAGERIVPELIQDAFTPEAVADEAVSMLTDGERARRRSSRDCARRARAAGRAGRQPARRRSHHACSSDARIVASAARFAELSKDTGSSSSADCRFVVWMRASDGDDA